MKYKVIKAFIDKDLKQKFNSGSEYEAKTKKRVIELQKKGFLGEEIVSESEKKVSE